MDESEMLMKRAAALMRGPEMRKKAQTLLTQRFGNKYCNPTFCRFEIACAAPAGTISINGYYFSDDTINELDYLIPHHRSFFRLRGQAGRDRSA